MTVERAFELDDLTVLLGLDLAEPKDRADIEAVEAVLDRRRTDGWSAPHGPDRSLRLVPDVSS